MSVGKLTPKQQRFVDEYVIDFNASAAAVRAGYAPSYAATNTGKLLKNENIQAAISNKAQVISQKTETDAEWVRSQLREEALDRGDGSSHSARVNALNILAKINGMFELDNKQKTNPMDEFLSLLGGKVMGPVADDAE